MNLALDTIKQSYDVVLSTGCGRESITLKDKKTHAEITVFYGVSIRTAIENAEIFCIAKHVPLTVPVVASETLTEAILAPYNSTKVLHSESLAKDIKEGRQSIVNSCDHEPPVYEYKASLAAQELAKEKGIVVAEVANALQVTGSLTVRHIQKYLRFQQEASEQPLPDKVPEPPGNAPE